MIEFNPSAFDKLRLTLELVAPRQTGVTLSLSKGDVTERGRD